MPDADVVIVGAGIAGCVLALRLTEDPTRSVILIEAGPDFPAVEDLPTEVRHSYFTAPGSFRGGPLDWDFDGLGADGTAVRVPRGRLAGGSSAINAQIHLWPTMDDFEEYFVPAGGGLWSWPTALAALRRCENDADGGSNDHGRNGPLTVGRFKRDDWCPIQTAFVDGCVAAGFPYLDDHNGAGAVGVGPLAFAGTGGERFSAARTYLARARHRENLHVMAGCEVTRVLFRESTATGVAYLRDGQEQVLRAREVVLAAGTIGSPVLLLRSGVGPVEDLRKIGVPVVRDLDEVGRGLSDHPVVPLAWRRLPESRAGVPPTGCQVALRWTLADSPHRLDAAIICASFSTVAGRRGHYSGDAEAYGFLCHLMLARSRGRITLDSDRVVVDLGHLVDESDVRRMREVVQTGIRLGASRAFESVTDGIVQPSPAVAEDAHLLDAWIRESCTTAHHLTSTCRMGAVVDAAGQVYGVSGLRVVDASIMPVAVRANTAAATYAVAERIAALI
jgi:choline dehydrogenase